MSELLQDKTIAETPIENLDEQVRAPEPGAAKEVRVLSPREIGRRACHALGSVASMIEFSYPAGDKHITRF